MQSPAGLYEPIQTREAERAGFEPAVRFDPDTSLAMMRIRPLCHLSGSCDRVGEYRFITLERKSRTPQSSLRKTLVYAVFRDLPQEIRSTGFLEIMQHQSSSVAHILTVVRISAFRDR